MMFRISKNKENPYVMLDKRFLKDKNLSAKAKGILAYLLCLPDDWKIYVTELTQHFSDGVKAINAGIKELIAAGYIRRTKIRSETGHFKGYEYTVLEIPTEMPFTENGNTENGKRHTTNTDKLNKEERIFNVTDDASDAHISFFETFQQFFGYPHRKVKVYPCFDGMYEYEPNELVRMYIGYFRKYGTNDKRHNLEKCSINNVFASAERYERKGEW